MRQTPMTLEEWLLEDRRRSVTICASPEGIAAFANKRKGWEFERQGEGIKDTLESLAFAIDTNDRKKKCLPPVRESVDMKFHPVAVVSLLMVLLGVYYIVDGLRTAILGNTAAIEQITKEVGCAVCAAGDDR